MSARRTYVYDKRIDKIVEKRSRDGVIEMIESPQVPEWWSDYLKMMDDTHDILAGREPRHGNKR